MKTLAESFAVRFGGTPADAERRLFWRCLHRRTWVFLPFLITARPWHFRADRDLIRRAAKAVSLREVQDEISDFLSHPDNMNWLRSKAHCRVSTQRLRRIARGCFESTASTRLAQANG